MNKLSERMRKNKIDITWSVSRTHATIDIWADKVAQLEAENESLKKYLSETMIFRFALENGRREVHRSWRDNMLAQGREVPHERMAWKTLSAQDKLLDEKIALDVIKDYAVWLLGHIALEAGGE